MDENSEFLFTAPSLSEYKNFNNEINILSMEKDMKNF